MTNEICGVLKPCDKNGLSISFFKHAGLFRNFILQNVSPPPTTPKLFCNRYTERKISSTKLQSYVRDFFFWFSKSFRTYLVILFGFLKHQANQSKSKCSIHAKDLSTLMYTITAFYLPRSRAGLLISSGAQ